MPVLPIDYAQKMPSGDQPNVRARMDTDTGAGALWGAVAQAGETVGKLGTELFSRIQTLQDSTELDTLRRQDLEAQAALQQHLDTSTDTEANKQAIQAFLDQRQAATGSNPRVQRARASYLSEYIPKTTMDFNWQNTKKTVENAKAQSEVNLSANLLSGNKVEYDKILTKLVSLGVLPQATAEEQSKQFATNHALTHAQYEINSGVPARVEAAVASLEKVSNTNADQQDALAKLKNLGRVQLDHIRTENYMPLAGAVEDATDTTRSPAERMAILQKSRQDITAAAQKGDISELHRKTLDTRMGSIERSILAGEKMKADVQTQLDGEMRIAAVHSGMTPDDIKAGAKWFYDNSDALGSEARAQLARYMEASKRAQTVAAANSAITELATANVPLELRPKIMHDLSVMYKAKPDQTPEDRMADAAKHVALVMDQANRDKQQKVEDRMEFKSSIDIPKLEGDIAIKRAVLQGHMKQAALLDEETGKTWAKQNQSQTEIGQNDKLRARIAEKRAPVQTEMDKLDAEIKQDQMRLDAAKKFAKDGLPASVPTISSDDEYDKLPSGATFIGPDGKQRRKP